MFCCLGMISYAQEIRFIQNKGQWPAQVLFKADIPGGDLYITPTGLVYNLVDEAALHEVQHNKSNMQVKAHAIFVDFVGAQQPAALGENPFITQYNYYLGNDPSKWAEGVKGFQKVVLRGVYPHVDFVLEGQNGWIKTSFVLTEGANARAIKLHYRGADDLLLQQGALFTKHSLGEFKEDAPETFITHGNFKQPVISAFKVNADTLSYEVMLPKGLSYQDSLIIDPSLVFSTFSGSVADNFGFTATFDQQGNGYGGGTVYASGFPTTTGAYQLTFAGGSNADGTGSRDAGILKFSPNGNQLLYATYLGGNNNEQPHSMSCDASGNLYILGSTRSANFPYKLGYDASHNGAYDIFIASLSANGNALRYATFYGSTSDDGINFHTTTDGKQQLQYNYGDEFRGDIRIDPLTGNICIASTTASSALTLPNATQATFGGAQDGLVLMFTPDLSTLLFGTFIGGNGYDAAYGLRIDGTNLYVTGGTLSTNLPNQSTNGTFLYHGGVDGFVAKYTLDLLSGISNPINLYIGTSGYDQSYFVFTDNSHKIYVTGQTTGTFDKAGNVYYESGGRQFITVIDTNMNNVSLQTTFGSGTMYPKLSPSAFLVDDCDRVYLSGWGGSVNQNHNVNTSLTNGLVTTTDAYQRTTDGSDFYLIIFNKNLVNVGYATYFGGPNSHEHVDGGTSHFDEAGVVYQSVCAGCGGLSDFPTSPTAYSRTNNGKRPNNPNQGGCNNAVFKFNARPTPYPPLMRDTTLVIYATDSIDYTFSVTDANQDSIRVTQWTGTLTGFTPPYKPVLNTISNSPGLLQLNLKWMSGCMHADDTLRLALNLSDNACEAQQSSIGNITVIVKPTPSPVIDLSCVKRSGQSDVSIDWSNTQTTFQKYINYINVNRSTNGGSSDSIGSIFTPSTAGNYRDLGLAALATNNYCYRLVAVNACGVKSSPSRLSCTMSTDTSGISIFKLSKDTFWYVNAADTLNALFMATDTVFNDSVFISYFGTLATDPFAQISSSNDLGNAQLSLNFTPPCNYANDTLLLKVMVMDNRCPVPHRDSALIHVVVLPAPPAQSIALNCLKSLGGNEVSITWGKNTLPDYLSYFKLIKRAQNGNLQTIGQFDFSQAAPIVQSVVNPTQDTTCFALVAYNRCEVPTDTGVFSCVPWPLSAYPQGVLPHYVTVINNKHIELSWHNDSLPEAEIFRFNPITNTKTLLASVSTAPTDSVWVDTEVDVQKQRYCYVIEPLSECGLRPNDSKYACSILLTGKSIPFEHQLDWTPYDYFATGADKHELFKRDFTQTNFSLQFTAPQNKIGSTTDNTLNRETGLFYYYVKATENQPNNYTSQSNTIELVQAPLLYVPNAFSPNGDAVNDTWNIVPVFVKDYHLRVYDRWGKLVFETRDKHKQLSDKDLTNELIALDAFVYVVSYTGFEGTVKQLTGNVTILK